MKNESESSTITLIEKDDGRSMTNQHKPYQKLSCIKKDHAVNLVGLQRYFELLPNNRTINSDVYCQQLVKLKEAIKEKRQGQNWQIAKEFEASHICSNTYETFGALLGSDVVSPIQP